MDKQKTFPWDPEEEFRRQEEEREKAEIRKLGGEGILVPEDLPELRAGKKRVFELMSDFNWHTRAEIDMAAGEHGVPAAEGTRRLRQLAGDGHLQYERRRGSGGGRHFEYRRLKKEEIDA